VSAGWDGLAVTSAGSGSGVLWLHGYTMRAQVWRPLWERLPGRRHLGLDLPWHGGSRAPADGETLADLAATVTTAAVAAGVRHVVALSFGTVLAVEMARTRPDAFASWTLAAPALAGMPHEPAVRRRYLDLATLYRAAGPGPHLTELWMSCPPGIFAGVAVRPDLRAALAAVIDRHRWDELRGEGLHALVRHPQHAADLAAVRAPVLLLVGDAELLHHRACARSIAAAVPTATVRVIPGTGHLAPLEDPAAAAALIAPHLAAADGSRAGGWVRR
jgi:pimeloyl-ACP methyl ester carboxylesterase